ncbi:hypothetical protein [Sphingobium yanoikuyae]|uniref:DUF3617 domain-containing protein n=1 Tax=Sphingobium yanoikuyae TaxID=13690 RepID=UPI0028AE6965|nr:hypothetical protein [Sphingobium yanoikuyae]
MRPEWMCAALLLAGCRPALDDPDNVPRLGRWRDETVPIGISIDDRGVPDGELPGDFRDLLAKLDRVEEHCGEPYLRKQDEMERFLNQRFEGCRVERLDRDGPAVSGLASCAPIMRSAGKAVTPAVRFDGMIGPDRLQLDMRMIQRLSLPTGSNHMLVISARRTLRRIGDC